jgi:excisionase family DNA binding protein
LSAGDTLNLENQPLPLSSAEAFLEALAQRVAELVLAGMPEQWSDEPQQWFTVKQAAAYCGVSEDAIRSALKPGGRLHEHKTTRGVRSVVLRRAVLDAWMQGEL